MEGVPLFFGGGAPEPRKVWEQVKLKFSHAARTPRVTIRPATQAILIVTLSPPRTNCKPLFYKLNILSLYSIFKFHVSCFVTFQ